MDLKNEYFKWMYRLVCDPKYIGRLTYYKLLGIIFQTEFYYLIDMDSNRYEDGIQLRYRFGRDNDIPDPVIADGLDTEPCSVLEMMVALALRIEESYMTDESYGDRTAKWFWEMINNLGLAAMSDSGYFNDDYVMVSLNRLLNRKYDYNGKGGLFVLPTEAVRRDMREVEIWYQAMWYLSYITRKES